METIAAAIKAIFQETYFMGISFSEPRWLPAHHSRQAGEGQCRAGEEFMKDSSSP
jgi:hypothetical protein